jgi:modulator of FtsH protease
MGYDVESWHELFVAAAGAAAALAGLVFVAVSINVQRILQFAWLPARSLRTVMLLIGVVIV